MIVDLIGATFLVFAGARGIQASRIIGLGGRGGLYWRLVGLGLIYLAFDEVLGIHEALGRVFWGFGLPTPSWVNHLDDVVVPLYAAAGVAVSLTFWREVLRFRRVWALSE